MHLGNAERAGQHTVVAGDATRLSGRLNDTILRAFNRIGRADFGARGRVAMHAHDRCRLRRLSAVDEFQMDHRMPLVRITFGTSLHARLAADAAVWIDEEELVL